MGDDFTKTVTVSSNLANPYSGFMALLGLIDPAGIVINNAIIFGLIFATLLTLGVVPILYSLFFRVSFKGFVY
ncbi:MAG: hypothetical protein OSB03_15210 [Vicinamibacterales bacterium]|nr:hypothetical protein [Vicinamibacterales bacterium]